VAARAHRRCPTIAPSRRSLDALRRAAGFAPRRVCGRRTVDGRVSPILSRIHWPPRPTDVIAAQSAHRCKRKTRNRPGHASPAIVCDRGDPSRPLDGMVRLGPTLSFSASLAARPRDHDVERSAACVSKGERTEHGPSALVRPNKLNGIGKVWLPEQDSNLRPFD
jgi:hypothetical protein